MPVTSVRSELFVSARTADKPLAEEPVLMQKEAREILHPHLSSPGAPHRAVSSFIPERTCHGKMDGTDLKTMQEWQDLPLVL